MFQMCEYFWLSIGSYVLVDIFWSIGMYLGCKVFAFLSILWGIGEFLLFLCSDDYVVVYLCVLFEGG